jgi:hypothetical protein
MMHLGQLKIVDRKTTSTSTTSDVVQTGINPTDSPWTILTNRQTEKHIERLTNRQKKIQINKQIYNVNE